MMSARLDPKYDPEKPYDWNYRHPPRPVELAASPVTGEWNFCGLKVASPLGIAAGPLLNGDWVLYYAGLGFDVLTYKTVRSVARECYPLPNLLPVTCGQLTGGADALVAAPEMSGSWAVSFGMPSQQPDVWRRDVENTRRRLAPSKILSVSVVGSVQPDWGIDELATDYAQCAAWAVESGADAVEVNFSCPNVSTCDGQLYQMPESAAVVAASVRRAIGRVPLVVKIGHLRDAAEAEALIAAVAPHVDALAMTNSVATHVTSADGAMQFGGERRGICGDAVRTASLHQTQMVAEIIGKRRLRLKLVGVGGISTAEHVRQYLAAGAHAVHLATAVMTDPRVGLLIRKALREGSHAEVAL